MALVVQYHRAEGEICSVGSPPRGRRTTPIVWRGITVPVKGRSCSRCAASSLSLRLPLDRHSTERGGYRLAVKSRPPRKTTLRGDCLRRSSDTNDLGLRAQVVCILGLTLLTAASGAEIVRNPSIPVSSCERNDRWN